MPYVIRDANHTVIRADVRPIVGGEMVPYDHADLATYLTSHGQDPAVVQQYLVELRQTDAAMSRAIEDVIMALLKKNILKMADLPLAVQDRMSYRLKLRVMIQEIFDKASNSRPE